MSDEDSETLDILPQDIVWLLYEMWGWLPPPIALGRKGQL